MIDYKDLGKDKVKKTKKTPGKNWIKIIAIVFAVIFISGILTSSAYFYAKYTKKHYVLRYVAITGNKILSVNAIKKLAYVDKSASMSSYDERKIYSNLMLNPWIKRAYVAKLYPDTIYIKIEEWKPKGIVVYKKKMFVVNKDGKVISEYKKNLNIAVSRLPRIVINNSNYMKNFLIGSIIDIYEKLDKFDKINYIEVISDSYQLVHFANSLNVAVNSLNCPKEAFIHLRKEWNNLVSKKGRLDSVSICFRNKFVLRWKKEKEGGGN